MTTLLALSSTTVIVIVAIVVIDLFAVTFGLSFLRARKAQQAGIPGAAPETPGKPAPKPVSRREFFRDSLIVSLVVFGAQFGAATIAFLWPNFKGSFGSVINAGNIADIKAEIADTEAPAYNGAGRFYLVPYNGKPSSDVDYSAEGATSEGLMSLYQKCPHLGCRVPFCNSSKWFECPCHGSKYNEAGEYKLGPAPRGMDRFKISVDSGGNVSVDTSEPILGPPRGTDTIDEPQQGPFCVAPG